ncbi:hypothetical protein, partial [Streptomyces sp. NPDC057509]|uniref:hypothetical protein n=1 Tax=Streptomyces sp. NPDC057509 TaxID=3346152 RepID=UPI00367BDCF2
CIRDSSWCRDSGVSGMKLLVVMNQRLTAAERRKKALALQLAGVDLRTIADQVGYADASAAKKGIDRAIEESIARERSDIDELRRREVMRLDWLQAAFWTPAVKDRDKKAADIVLKCIAARDRLQGLAAP